MSEKIEEKAKSVEKPKPTVIDVPQSDAAEDDKPETPGKRVAEAEDAPPGGRAAQLRLSHIEPWTATRVAFAVSCAMAIVFVVAAIVFWIVMKITGVFGQVDEAVTSVLSDGTEQFTVSNYFGFWRMIFYALVLAVINIVMSTALAAIGARIYNTVAELVGGVQVTFSDD